MKCHRFVQQPDSLDVLKEKSTRYLRRLITWKNWNQKISKYFWTFNMIFRSEIKSVMILEIMYMNIIWTNQFSTYHNEKMFWRISIFSKNLGNNKIFWYRNLFPTWFYFVKKIIFRKLLKKWELLFEWRSIVSYKSRRICSNRISFVILFVSVKKKCNKK